MCLESGKDWEKNLPAALLALRTVTHESTGFSPAELVHGKNLRVPETLLYDHWVNPEETDSAVTEYVFDLINRMKECQELAVERMSEAQNKRKFWYDKGSVRRQFKKGDRVLVLATARPNKLAAQWVGPGVVESQISDTNYMVRMQDRKDRSQIYHVNMLKPYYQRAETVNLVFTESEGKTQIEKDLEIAYPIADPDIYDLESIVRDSNLEERLSESQIFQLNELINKNKKVFSNDPGKTNLVEFDIELTSEQFIRSKPYRASRRQTELLKIEIQRMLDLNLIEIGKSDYTYHSGGNTR
jgi:hypothetical protein